MQERRTLIGKYTKDTIPSTAVELDPDTTMSGNVIYYPVFQSIANEYSGQIGYNSTNCRLPWFFNSSYVYSPGSISYYYAYVPRFNLNPTSTDVEIILDDVYSTGLFYSSTSSNYSCFTFSDYFKLRAYPNINMNDNLGYQEVTLLPGTVYKYVNSSYDVNYPYLTEEGNMESYGKYVKIKIPAGFTMDYMKRVSGNIVNTQDCILNGWTTYEYPIYIDTEE